MRIPNSISSQPVASTGSPSTESVNSDRVDPLSVTGARPVRRMHCRNDRPSVLNLPEGVREGKPLDIKDSTSPSSLPEKLGEGKPLDIKDSTSLSSLLEKF